jgi:hypothetical protein
MPARAFDLDALGERLVVPGWERATVPAFAADSYAFPAAFFASLGAAQERLAQAPVKSVFFERYDPFHDLCARHARSEAAAIIDHENGRPRAISYAELAAMASRRAGAWARAGVEQGQVIAIVRRPGVELAVSVLAALELGAVLAIVPPEGRRSVSARLALCEADHVDAGEGQGASLADDGGAPSSPLDRSASYPTGAIVARLFDPAGADGAAPRELTIDAAYLCALRDGLVTLGLRAGDAWAAPGAHALSTQPALLFAGMFAGATWVHLAVDDVERDPRVLAAQKLRALLVSAELREAILAQPTPLGDAITLWLRDPAEATSVERWQDFVRAAGLERALAGNVRIHAAHGGSTLASPRRTGVAHLDVFPPFGQSWRLADPVTPEANSPGNHGLLALAPPGAAEPPETIAVAGDAVVIAHAHGQGALMFGGSMAEGHAGRTYPRRDAHELLAAAAHALGHRGASVVVSRAGAIDAQVTMVLFTGIAPVDEAALLRRVRTLLADELGDDATPDRIVCYPLEPRRVKGELDHAWVASEHISGRLARKARDPLVRALSELRAAITEENVR